MVVLPVHRHSANADDDTCASASMVGAAACASPTQRFDGNNLPLRAWRSRGGHWAPVPQILGLDEYGYTVGTRTAARAESRFSQEVAEELAFGEDRAVATRASSASRRASSMPLATGKAPTCASHRDAQAPPTRPVPRRQCFMEAGGIGGTVMLCNSKAGSVSQLQKRRQKLTKDMLMHIVVTCKEPFRVVSWWFSVFESYCDRPIDPALPELPQRREMGDSPDREGGELPSKEGAGSRARSSLVEPRRNNGPGSSSARSNSCCSLGGRSLTIARSDDKPKKGRKLSHPELRQSTKCAVPSAPRLRFNEPLWDQRQKELRKRRTTSGTNKDHELASRARTQILDSEQWSEWTRDYEAKLQAAAEGSMANRSIAKSSGVKMGETEGDAADAFAAEQQAKKAQTDAMVQRVFSHMLLHENNVEDCAAESGSASDDCGDGEENTNASNASAEALNDGAEVIARSVMLRSVSHAMINCSLLRKAKRGSTEQVPQSFPEVQDERSRILRGIVPVEMSPKNFFRAAGCLGLARGRASDRIFADLLCSAPPLAHSRPNNGLPFQAFYQLVRALLQGRSQASRGSRGASTRILWQDSGILRRLLFAVLAGRPTSTAKGVWVASEKERVPLSFASLLESLGLFMCKPVLLEASNECLFSGASEAAKNSFAKEQSAPAAPNQTQRASNIVSFADSSNRASGLTDPVVPDEQRAHVHNIDFCTTAHGTGTGSQLHSLAQCLHRELLRAEAESTADVHETDDVIDMISFRGFERFVWQHPVTFSILVQLLFPLVSKGESLMTEEMRLAGKQLSQRVGELRYSMNAQAQRIQKRLLARLHSELSRPFEEARR